MSRSPVFLPISDDVRLFLYHDEQPGSESKVRRHFRRKFRSVEDFEDAHDNVYQHLMDHLTLSEQESIVSENEKGKQLKELRLVSKIEKLKTVLFVEKYDEIVDENDTVPLHEYMEMKSRLENLLLEARDEIVQLKEEKERNNESEPNSNRRSREFETDTDPDYSNMNSALHELAVLRELRRRHNGGGGKVVEVEEVEEVEQVEEVGEVEEVEQVEKVEQVEETVQVKGEQEQKVEGEQKTHIPFPEIRCPDPVIQERLISPEVYSDPIEELCDNFEQTLISRYDLECPICYNVLNTDPDSPHYTGCCIGEFCGHALCETCWKNYRSRRNRTCPICRQLLFIGRGRPKKANVW